MSPYAISVETHPKARGSDDDSAPTGRSSESSAFADYMPSEPQLATYQAHAGDKINDGSAAVHSIWPAHSIDTSTKEQRDRIIEAIKSVTDKPEEIHNCLLGEILIFAKASMTAAQAAMLRNHPDIGAVCDGKDLRQIIIL